MADHSVADGDPQVEACGGCTFEREKDQYRLNLGQKGRESALSPNIDSRHARNRSTEKKLEDLHFLCRVLDHECYLQIDLAQENYKGFFSGRRLPQTSPQQV